MKPSGRLNEVLRACRAIWRGVPLAVGTALLFVNMQAAATLAPGEGMRVWVRAVSQALDDPHAALSSERAQLGATGDPEQSFWHWLAAARIHVLLDQNQAAGDALQQAQASLARMPDPREEAGLALALQQVQSDAHSETPASLRTRLESLLATMDGARYPRLKCEAQVLGVRVLREAGALDEAWMTAEQAEDCAQALGDPLLMAGVALQMGNVAYDSMRRSQVGSADEHFQRALRLIEGRPARYLRGVLEWQIGRAYGQSDPVRALAHLERSQDLAAEIGDDVGVGIVAVARAGHLLHRGDSAAALRLALEARGRFERAGAPHRVASTFAVSIPAMAALGDPALSKELSDSRTCELVAVSRMTVARLASARAQAYAALGMHRPAYDDMQRAYELEAESRRQDVEKAAMHLQAAYDAAQRKAETARLRQQEESARLELQAAQARQSALLAVVAGLCVSVAAVGSALLNAYRQRRRMTDLAMRDELTGAPNRRSIMEIARSQWEHCRTMGTPLCVAMLDLDHFKRVNDVHGHEVGDAALRSFAAAVRKALRTHDRMGRYGGEEWLLVAPGMQPDQVQQLFDRLRAQFRATPIEGLGQPHGLSFSMGAAFAGPGLRGLDELVSQADAALYAAKAQGRDRVCLHASPLPARPQVETADQARAATPERASNPRPDTYRRDVDRLEAIARD